MPPVKPTRITAKPFKATGGRGKSTMFVPTDAGIMTITDLAKAVSLKTMTLYNRIKKLGWEIKDIFAERIPNGLERKYLTLYSQFFPARKSRAEKLKNIKVGSWELEQLKLQEEIENEKLQAGQAQISHSRKQTAQSR